jgi:gamma-glutamylcyclotransferase (GGCT)/AIG2-like uncharacterized protein YtfP
MSKVAGCQSDSLAATLKDFQRSAIHGEKYPGIFHQADGIVEGVLYLHLPEEAMLRLDQFEGEQYSREEVQVITQQGSCRAMAYIIKPQYRHLLTGEPWSFEDFLASEKAEFLNYYQGFQKI